MLLLVTREITLTKLFYTPPPDHEWAGDSSRSMMMTLMPDHLRNNFDKIILRSPACEQVAHLRCIKKKSTTSQ